MSASLVGSEMCIRDSASFPDNPNKGPKYPITQLHAGVVQCDGMLESVSYTHLTLPTICSV
eukprot:2769925-Alexandrium_andersonii.AAC.1